MEISSLEIEKIAKKEREEESFFQKLAKKRKEKFENIETAQASIKKKLVCEKYLKKKKLETNFEKDAINDEDGQGSKNPEDVRKTSGLSTVTIMGDLPSLQEGLTLLVTAFNITTNKVISSHNFVT